MSSARRRARPSARRSKASARERFGAREVERRAKADAHLDRAGDAFDESHDPVTGRDVFAAMTLGQALDRHEVRQARATVSGLEPGAKNVRLVGVRALDIEILG